MTNKKPTIIISGKNGQLGRELQDIANTFPDFNIRFFAKDELDITDNDALEKVFKNYGPSFFINTAAYTAVDKAETEQEIAYLVNAVAVDLIARNCKRFDTTLIHISTDYVFDGKAAKPYKEDDETNPINYYGYSKWIGEELALHNNPKTIVIRTSWVYGSYGNNFVKTMLRLMNERTSISVVNDQLGSPTYAKDLAAAILKIAGVCKQLPALNYSDVYHFSNDGVISWYDFAVAIKEIKNFTCVVNPIETEQYPTPAKRPSFAVFDKTKIQFTFGIELRNWRVSLEECLETLR